ncbi:MAG: translation initiation factor IF-2 [Muribaculaceae bacterium]|nr:translation initiation factor IF-2 [Muribaculaceae bacterium]
MAKKKLSNVAKELNVALPTVIEFLNKKNISIDANPNVRVDEDIVSILEQEFQKDKATKSKTDQIMAQRAASKPQPAKEPVKETPASSEPIRLGSQQKPRFLGKIELDAKGNPVAPKAEVKPRPEAPEKEAKLAEAPKAENPTPVVEKKDVAEAPAAASSVQPREAAPEVTPVQKEAEPVKKEPEIKEVKEAPAKAAEETVKETEVEAPADHKEENHTQKSEDKPQETNDEPEFIPTRTVEGPTLNIVGKIDLDALNQSTRPKKKNKAKGGAQNAAAGTASGDRKKRRRISGKEKVDIEKAAAQANNDRRNSGGQGNGKNNRHNNAKDSAKPKNNRPAPAPEVSDEDVQRQVKETLARLTSKDKGLKKGAKWRKEKREANASREREAARAEQAESKTLKLTEFVTANDLAVMMDVPVNNVIATCMNLGVMVSINQRLDAETINIVADEFGFKTEYVSAEVADAIGQVEDNEEDLLPRPPIVTVMGHVDHGKTSLLDYIRHANVIAGEAGGITQHIGSYSVTLADGRHITFLDTPGHEAFTAMRARGAKVTDIVIIIVAADDNVMPQTVEAINHASAAGVPIVFAINKIDKPHANPEKIKEELAAMNYLVEEWGGKYQSQDISAKKGIGVEELMEKVLLEAELLELKANPDRNATGAIIESSLDKGRGYVANVLVQNGTLRVGDIVLAGNHYGKVKAMFNERGQRIKEAGPATPALILGLNGAPTAGDTFNVMDTEQEAREIATKREQLQREQGLRTTKILTLEDIGRRRAIGNFQELNIIVKGDVDGSIEALSDSLIKLSTEEIQVNVLHKAVGEISESDVTLAAASDAVIIGFQVRPSLAARRAAEREGVDIRLYSIIYQAIEEVKDAMEGMLAPEIKEEVTGTAEVLETYHISKVGTIAGAMVREGKLKRGSKVRLIREGIVRYTGELGSLKRFKDDVKEVLSGYDCGLSIAGYNDIKVGDIVEGFEEVEVSRTL